MPWQFYYNQDEDDEPEIEDKIINLDDYELQKVIQFLNENFD